MNVKSKVLALKYRPVVFNDIIGQKIISDAIFNAIKNNKTPNAYLFTGIRGVGKTTFARIVAKALNCKNKVDNLCKENLCENCFSISNSNNIDVIEIDAASKTSVDDVRDLIDLSRYGPTSSKYKIFIIDEVHMLSKQAFNALLKTLEEPPQYQTGGGLKFIFATTEIKKIPITVLSRCQRFDLSRVRSEELFLYIQNVCKLENGNISNDALRLIVKISEGSVRDALSLLDRALLSNQNDKRLELADLQKIFGYFDKSYLVELFENIFIGNQQKTLDNYRNIYNQGVEPKIFLNDFLEILYYLKNIKLFDKNTKNFDLNNKEFELIKALSDKINTETLILFWQFTIKTLEELNVVSDQNISVEMFLIRLLHIKSLKTEEYEKNYSPHKKLEENKLSLEKNVNKETISQIKNITQEKNVEGLDVNKDKIKDIQVKSFNDLIELCNTNREIKLKYELENNVNLVNFENGRIEISINEKLEKNFIKILSNKLLEWTNKRWMISLSSKTGEKSKKEIEDLAKKKIFEDEIKTEEYQRILKTFSDAELIEIKKKNE